MEENLAYLSITHLMDLWFIQSVRQKLSSLGKVANMKLLLLTKVAAEFILTYLI